MKLHGIFPPITTPFDRNGDLYPAKVRHNVEKWNLTALAGYVVTGSTGEAVLLTAEEKARLWGLVAEAAAAEKILIAGTGAESVRETVALTNQAAALGYKAALVRTPHDYKNMLSDPAAQMLFFRAVADQSKIPVLIYNFPAATGIDLPAEAVAELSAHPNVAGIKESSGNIEKIMRMARETEPGFQVLAGSAGVLWPALMAGAAGAILAFSNAAPYATIAIWEAWRGREYDAAADWQNRIARAARLVPSLYGVAGLKHAMDLNGYYGGPPRLPLTPPSPEARREIEDAFRDLKG
jgi:4-hydroxy-2-oxoglutarate aldolase